MSRKPREVRLNCRGPLEYVLTITLGDYVPGSSIFFLGDVVPVDKHFIVYASEPSVEDVCTEAVGVVHSLDELPEKVYNCARKVGLDYATKFKCGFFDSGRVPREEFVKAAEEVKEG